MDVPQILKNLPSTSIIALGYHIYVDTNIDLGPSFGSFCTTYDPNDEDPLKAKIPMATGLLRNVELTSDDGKRFFHIINRNKHEVIDNLKDQFSFPYVHQTKDSRTRLIDSSEVIVLDYSEKSVAVFPITKKTRDYLDTLASSVKFNSGLTGPDLKKTKGYIIAKSNFRFKNIMETLSSFEVDKKSPIPVQSEAKESVIGAPSQEKSGRQKEQQSEDPKFDGEGMKPLHTTPGENKRLQIWGPQEYIISITKEIEEDKKTKVKILEDKNLSGDRKLLQIEIIEE